MSEPTGVARLTRPRLAGRLGQAALVALLVALLGPAARVAGLDTIGALGALGLWLSSLVLRTPLWPRRGVVRVDGGGLRVVGADGRVRLDLPRAAIEQGFVTVLRDGPGLELALSGGRLLQLRFATRAQAEASCAALGLFAPGRRLHAWVGARGTRAALGLGLVVTFAVLWAVVLFSHPLELVWGTYVLWVLSTALSTALTMHLSRPVDVTVGADGVEVRGPLGRRFVRLEEIWHVTGSNGRCVLLLEDGERLTLGGLGVSSRMSSAVAQRVLVAVAAGARGARFDRVLERGGRPIAEWRRALGRVLASAYRDRSLTEGEVVRALERPGAANEARIGAATALAATGDEGRARVRVAAEQVVDERLRRALEAIAAGEGEEEAIAEALAEEAG